MLCSACIFATLREAWPEDIGITLEGADGSFEFLHVVLKWERSTGKDICVELRCRNLDYILGHTELQAVAGLCPYIAGVTHLRAIGAASDAMAHCRPVWAVACMLLGSARGFLGH